jgi:hypothetical protein
MAALNWNEFQRLPGAVDRNFENLCRAVVRTYYEKYGNFAALAAQPGVEFHLKLQTSCPLGEAGRWYGWQCRWYQSASGTPIGTTRKEKILKAIRKTKRVLPKLTDWVLWTRWPLTAADQKWFYGLKTGMRMHLWSAEEVESFLGGEALYLRNTYFGEWILTPESLARWHEASVAPIRRRWQPEVHQVVDAERRLREALGESKSWHSLTQTAEELAKDGRRVLEDLRHSAPSVKGPLREAVIVSQGWANKLTETLTALEKGDLNLLRQLLGNLDLDQGVAALPRQLRARRQRVALSATNLVADIRIARELLRDVNQVIGKSLIAVVAEAGCGKTQLSAQLTSPSSDRPAGVLLHGKSLNAGDSLNSLAARLSMPSGNPVPSIDALLAAVDAAGQRVGRRLPIVIDVLNEAEDPREWKAHLSSLQQALRGYPYVLLICTVRETFAESALPDEVERVTIENFGRDATDALFRYFDHYKIKFVDVDLPVELLKHPLTLRLFCEVTNPNPQHAVEIEVAPQSLSELFDRYLDHAIAQIVELAPRTRQYQKLDVERALDAIGIALWSEKTRTLDVDTLRRTLGEESRPWTESIISALEHGGVILREPAKPPEGPRLMATYDLLAGHLAATAILARQSASGFEVWAKDPTTIDAFRGPAMHPLRHDIFTALAGLAPRRLRRQLWPMLEGPLRDRAIRAAADLEGKYLNQETITELTKLVLEGSAETIERDILARLWNTRGLRDHPLNASFLDRVLRSMSMANRDLRWTEWVHREHVNILGDLGWLEKRWRQTRAEVSEPDTLRALWVQWMLTSTIREVRDQATKTLYWFGRRNPAALFDLTIDSLSINDPYICERMLAASYGVSMTLQYSADAFRDNLLPSFAKKIFELVFDRNAPFATTHSLRRDYAKGIVVVALGWHPGILTTSDRARLVPPFSGGIRNWQRRPDYDHDKYRNGNDPLGFDWENYTMGSLARGRSTYDFEHPDFVRVKEEILWRIHDLGYSLDRFGEIDSRIADSRHRYRPDTAERYGKKYSWIAFYELWGFRGDQGLLEEKPWRGQDPHPEEIDIDPSFPEQPREENPLEVDILGKRHPDAVRWVDRGPIPAVGKWLVSKYKNPKCWWVLAHGGVFSHGSQVGRTGYLRISAYFLEASEVSKFRRLLRSKNVHFDIDRDPQDISGFFAGEFPWHPMIPYVESEKVQIPAGRRKVANSGFRVVVLSADRKEIRFDSGKQPPWRYETLFDSVRILPLAQRSVFGERSALERPSGLLPSRQIVEFAELFLRLPVWLTTDRRGRVGSMAFRVPGKAMSGSSLMIRKDIVDAYARHNRLRVIWVVTGERQRLSTSGYNAAYKQYLQVFLMKSRRVEKLLEVRDRNQTRRQNRT